MSDCTAANSLTVAGSQVAVGPWKNEASFWDALDLLCAKAALQTVDILVLPEYLALALTPFVAASGTPFLERLAAIAKRETDYVAQLRGLSRKHGVALVAGTAPVWEGECLINRAWYLDGDMNPVAQAKVKMTRAEAECWSVTGGDTALNVFRARGVNAVIATCYDVEFPTLVREAARAGAELILVPSCTGAETGYWRVRHCTHARAVELQCYGVMSSLIGAVPGFEDLDNHYGQAVVVTPSDVGFPSRGVAAEGSLNEQGLAVARLDLTLLRQTRENGSVFTLRDNLATRP